MPRSFYGDEPAIAIRDLNDFAVQMKGNPSGATVAAKSFEELYDQTSSSLLKETGKESFDAVKMLQKTDVSKYVPANNADYPASPLGNALKQKLHSSSKWMSVWKLPLRNQEDGTPL